ncbi:MAG: sialate O-acetylesterase [Ferruginibacter sp.]
MKRLLFLSLVCFAQLCMAQIKLPQIIRDSMVLQRDKKVNIWGWASPAEKITITFNNKKYKTTTSAEGKWMAVLPPTKAGGPYSITIAGKNSITLNQVLFGDVWFCSGQSNMVHQLNIHDVIYAKEIAEANNPNIRQFWVPNIANMQSAQSNLPSGYWKPAVGEDVRPFSAVAYFFAKKLYEQYHVPIGIINASWGGTPIEAWTSEEGLMDFADIGKTILKNKDTAYINGFNRRQTANIQPPPADAGLTGKQKWYEETYMPRGWKNINIPGYWEDQGIKDLNGTVWYRREINIPATMTGKAAKVFLGRIVDADELFINGRRIGNTTYQYPQRRYAVAADVLKAGKNIFVIRVRNDAGKGGFVPDKPYCVFSGNDTIDLKGTWQYKVGEVFKPSIGGGAAGIAAHLQPAALFNAMVNPEINFTIKGFCWYQGESNAGKPAEYAALLPALIKDWRSKWSLGELPFLYAQLPGFMDYNYLPSESNWAILRESQLKALAVNNTAMAVTIDLGEWNDIHPDNKKDVGERLALAAMKLAYNENIVYSGPLYQSNAIDGNKIIISFTNTGGGLVTNDGEAPSEFAIAGADKKFVWAKTKIEGDKIIAWNDAVASPLYIRYAWADNPVNPNVYNKEGLPASPFRTDNQ